jgi:hypothetical protein
MAGASISLAVDAATSPLPTDRTGIAIEKMTKLATEIPNLWLLS